MQADVEGAASTPVAAAGATKMVAQPLQEVQAAGGSWGECCGAPEQDAQVAVRDRTVTIVQRLHTVLEKKVLKGDQICVESMSSAFKAVN